MFGMLKWKGKERKMSDSLSYPLFGRQINKGRGDCEGGDFHGPHELLSFHFWMPRERRDILPILFREPHISFVPNSNVITLLEHLIQYY